MTRIGYARVSSRDQNLDSQIDLLVAAGCERIFEDKVSGVNESRPEWDRLLEFLRPGDTLVVARIVADDSQPYAFALYCRGMIRFGTAHLHF